MRTTTFILSFLLCINYATAQTGDEIATAVPVDDTSVIATHVTTATTTSISGFDMCVLGGEDAFYLNVVGTTENKITISMATTVGVLTNIHYQILRAPNGDTNNFTEVACGSYEVIVGAPPVTPNGGEFSTEITSNVNSGDEFYLRVFKPTDVTGPALTTLFNNTSVTMSSEFDVTLSNKNLVFSTEKLISKANELKILNNHDHNAYKIYGLDGKIVMNGNRIQPISNIDTSLLNNGLYVLALQNNASTKYYKFIKY